MQQESVILLHGLARSRWSLWRLERVLAQQYKIVNQSYPSRRHDIQTLAELAIEPALEACKASKKIHFVTHSLGGILVRQYLSEHKISKLGRVVMLGPPNRGSELVDEFRSIPVLRALFDQINGPAGAQLGTDTASRPQQLGAINFACGVIAGTRNFNLVYRQLLPEQSDGKVSVDSTTIEGVQEQLVLPVDHTFMMNDTRVIKACQRFLENGKF